MSNTGNVRRLTFLLEAVNNSGAAVQGAKADLDRLKDARLEASRVVLEETRAHRTLELIYRQQHRDLYETIGVMRSIGSIGGSLVSMWQAYTVSQLRLQDATENVNEAQENLNNALKVYPSDSVQVQKATKELEAAQRQLKQSQDDNTFGMYSMGLQAVGTAAQVGALALKLNEAMQKAGGMTASVLLLGEKLLWLAPLLVPLGVGYATKELLNDSPYWKGPNPNAPPGPGNGAGFDLGAFLSDLFKNLGGGGTNIYLNGDIYTPSDYNQWLSQLEDVANKQDVNKP